MTDSTTIVTLVDSPGARTEFSRREGNLWLNRLCGMRPGRNGQDTGPSRTQGVALVRADGQRYEGAVLTLEAVDADADGGTSPVLSCRWKVGETGLRLGTTWRGCQETGVVSRRDELVNIGELPITVSRSLMRVSLPSGQYECYTQASRWCHENQGAWQPLHTGLSLRHAWGRTTEESNPYLAIRGVGSGAGLAFHILPYGNWTIRVSTVSEGGDLPYAVVELGLADDDLHRILGPGETLALPEILVQPLPHGGPHMAAPALHRYLLGRHFAESKPQAPVVFNTWFEQFDILDIPRLRGQVAAAKAIGCEVFVIDAGWYGPGGPNWWEQAGDWREKTDAAFCGRMREFADEVRSAGLGFGLWMESERFGPKAPIREEHPEWFVEVGVSARLDLTQPDAYAYLRGEIGRLVETYALAWMKIDFNFTLDADASGGELSDYYAAWYRILDEVRASHPQTFFEGCASGAMRADLASLSHVDGHFLSDSVNPVDMLRISQGAWLRLPPGRLTRWTVVRSGGQAVPRYGTSVAESPATVLTPCGALWEPAETVDLNFALLAAMPGMLGFSGDIDSLSAGQRATMAQGVAFYKKWRRFITRSTAHLLTPPEPLTCREGWVGVQLESIGDAVAARGGGLVFVYRLGNCGAPPSMLLENLEAEARYAVSIGLDEKDAELEATGLTLMHDGLPLERLWHGHEGGHQANVYALRRVSKP